MSIADVQVDGAGRLLTPPGVYAPQSDTRLLARALREEPLVPGMDVAELGTGSGALAVYAARLGARVTAVDVAWRAVLTARLNAFLAKQRVTVCHGDLAEVLPRDSFDAVISNPPYVPAPTAHLPRRGAARAWDAGHDGRAIVDRICDLAPALLRPHGVLLMVHSGLCGTETTLEKLSAAGMRAEVRDRAYIPFGPVMRSRLDWLRAQGLVAPHEDKEELVVIRAERT